MAACSSCDFLDKANTQCLVGHKKVLRNCLTPILKNYHTLMKPGNMVLEIGCGAWSPTHDYCQLNGIAWEAIDILDVYLGKKTIATKIASVAAIPFADSCFDFVIANQSMEHWEENYVSIQQGLNEVFRVLKPGGTALLNVPIHFHGGYRFMSGDLDNIKKLFDSYSSSIHLESWRNPPDPLPPFYHLRRSFWFNKLGNKSAYILDIRVIKKNEPIVYAKVKSVTPISKIIDGLKNQGMLYYLTNLYLNIESKMKYF